MTKAECKYVDELSGQVHQGVGSVDVVIQSGTSLRGRAGDRGNPVSVFYWIASLCSQ